MGLNIDVRTENELLGAALRRRNIGNWRIPFPKLYDENFIVVSDRGKARHRLQCAGPIVSPRDVQSVLLAMIYCVS